jgi:hypothetical protein
MCVITAAYSGDLRSFDFGGDDCHGYSSTASGFFHFVAVG